MTKVDAIVLCGRSDRDQDLLHNIELITGKKKVESKSLLKIGGKEIVRYMCDEINSAPSIGNIYIAGLKEKDIQFDYDVKYIDFGRNDTTVVDKLQFWVNNFLLTQDNPPSHALILSGDIPAIKAEYVEWFVQEIKNNQSDFHYSVVEKTDMEIEFPNSMRSFVKLKDAEVCGGDVTAINPRTINDYADTFRNLIDKRKSFIRQVIFVAPFMVIKILLKRASLQELADTASKALKMSVNIVKTPYAPVAMDIDKIHQFEIVKEYLENR